MFGIWCFELTTFYFILFHILSCSLHFIVSCSRFHLSWCTVKYFIRHITNVRTEISPQEGQIKVRQYVCMHH